MVLHGIPCSGGSRGDANLAKDRGEVGVDGAGADHQLLRNLLVGQPLRHQAQHPDFTDGQSIGISGGFPTGEAGDDPVGGISFLTGLCAAKACSTVMIRPWAHAVAKVCSPS